MTKHLTKPIHVAGITTRTKSSDEIMGHGKIVELWEEYRHHIYGQKIPTGIPIGIYYDYESDETGSYSLLAGVEVNEDFAAEAPVKTCTINEGHYLKFAAKGAMPNIVVETWQNIGRYFADKTNPYARTFTTDFELYPAFGEVEIYISIKPQS